MNEQQLPRDQLTAKTWFLQDKVDKLTREVSFDERCEMERAQARFDSVAAHTGGDRASDPILGESSLQYRMRLLKPLAEAHPKYRGSWLGGCESPVLELIETTVYHDAIEAAKNNVPPGQLKAVQERDSAGRLITRYYGDSAVWLRPYMSQGATCILQRNPPRKV